MPPIKRGCSLHLHKYISCHHLRSKRSCELFLRRFHACGPKPMYWFHLIWWIAWRLLQKVLSYSQFLRKRFIQFSWWLNVAEKMSLTQYLHMNWFEITWWYCIIHFFGLLFMLQEVQQTLIHITPNITLLFTDWLYSFKILIKKVLW